MSKIESAARIVLAFNEAVNRHDVRAMMALMSEDAVFENTQPAPDGTEYRGKAAIESFFHEFFLASPRAHFAIEDLHGLGRRCIVRWRYTWADVGGIEGHVRGVDIYLVEDDLIREKLSYVKG
jgi:ketosteroid isomerase-like protein